MTTFFLTERILRVMIFFSVVIRNERFPKISANHFLRIQNQFLNFSISQKLPFCSNSWRTRRALNNTSISTYFTNLETQISAHHIRVNAVKNDLFMIQKNNSFLHLGSLKKQLKTLLKDLKDKTKSDTYNEVIEDVFIVSHKYNYCLKYDNIF